MISNPQPQGNVLQEKYLVLTSSFLAIVMYTSICYLNNQNGAFQLFVCFLKRGHISNQKYP